MAANEPLIYSIKGQWLLACEQAQASDKKAERCGDIETRPREWTVLFPVT